MGDRNLSTHESIQLAELIDRNGSCVVCGHDRATHCAEVFDRGVVASVDCESCSPHILSGWEAQHFTHDDGTVDIGERHLVECVILKSCWKNPNPRKAVRILELEGEFSNDWQSWRLRDRRKGTRRKLDEDEINPKKEKHRFAMMQKNVCAGCQYPLPLHVLTIDHIAPRSKGGGNQAKNIQLLCSKCNSIKGNRDMEYLKLQLVRRRILKD